MCRGRGGWTELLCVRRLAKEFAGDSKLTGVMVNGVLPAGFAGGDGVSVFLGVFGRWFCFQWGSPVTVVASPVLRRD